MKTGVVNLPGICFKLCMMENQKDGATHNHGDIMSVINISSESEFVQKKKNNSVCCHTVCESIAMGALTIHIDGNENPADMLTKVLCSGKWRYLVNKILHD